MADAITNHPVLVFVRGMPGSGKSYLAAELAKSLGSERIVVLDPDAADYDSKAYKDLSRILTAEGVDSKVHPYRLLRSQAYDGITAGKIVIWNQPFTNRGMFDRLAANLQAYAAERSITLAMLLVEVDIDPATAKERVLQRQREGGHGPSEATLGQRISDYESFAGNGYETVSVQGMGDVADSVRAVQAALERLQK